LTKKRVVILGGGVGGLSAGWMLARTGGYEVTIIEKSAVTGGACGTFEYEEFNLDYGPHKAYSVVPGVLDELKMLMGDEFLQHKKKNSIYMFNSFLKYPISMIDIAMKMGYRNLALCGLNAFGSAIRRKASTMVPKSYETYLENIFGRKLYKIVFEPLAEKVWGDPSTLSCDIASTRIPAKSIMDLLLRAMGAKKESELTDAEYFYYPRKGFGRIAERMQDMILKHSGKVLTNAVPTEIFSKNYNIKEIQVMASGHRLTVPCDLLISAIPLDSLVDVLGTRTSEESTDVISATRKLQYREAFLVYIFLKRKMVTNHHWIFFPERDVIFSRVSEQKMMSKEMCPEDKTVLCCDFTDSPDGILCAEADDVLAERCISDLLQIGLIMPNWVEKTFVKRLPRFYPRYDLTYKENIGIIYSFLRKYDNLLLTGRVGFYNYNNCDHCVDMGKFIADSLRNGEKPRRIWKDLERRVSGYQIVD
jgi:protoporphyrinogen oxidase